MEVGFYINGVKVNEPLNYEELEIDITYDRDGNKRSSSTNNWTFGVNDQRKTNDAISVINAGIANGQGISEGLPYDIYIADGKGSTLNIFNGYLDLARAKYLCNEITAPAVEQGQLEWLNTVADTIIFELLYDEGKITDSDFIVIPYVLNRKQNTTDTIIAVFSAFILFQEITKQIIILSGLGIEAANPFQTATAIIKLILQITYVVALLIAFVKILLDLYNALIAPVKYHNGMKVLDLITIGLNEVGLQFSSSILNSLQYKNLVYLPEKYNINENNTGIVKHVLGNLLGNKNESKGYHKGTLGDLLRMLKNMFNAKLLIENGVLYFEKQDFKLNNGGYIAPKLIEEPYTFNWDEFKANYVLRFQTDLNDRNTIQDYNGNSIQISQQANVLINKRMSLMRGISENIIECSRGSRKVDFNFIENVYDAFFVVIGTALDGLIKAMNEVISVINNIIDFLNKIVDLLGKIGIDNPFGDIKPVPSIPATNIANIISKRKDMLMMESDYVSTPKLLLIDEKSNKDDNILIPVFNETYINAEYLYDNYHYFNNFVTTNGWNNQKKIYTLTDIPFTFDDYSKMRNNSLFFDANGNECTATNLRFNPIKQTASITYFKREIYLTNIRLIKKVQNE